MYSLRSIGLTLCLALGAGLATPAPVSAQVRTLKAASYAGKRYVALKDLAAMYGLPLALPGGKTLLIRGQYTSLQFTADGRLAVLNGGQVWLHAPITKVRGLWSISDADAQFVVDPIVRPSAYLAARGTRTVVLDAGHGAQDPGAQGRTGVKEKDLALDIALRTRTHLQAAGVRVVMTRETDRFWTLEDRPYLAARGGGDVFVSIHLNAASSRSVKGVETFVTAAENFPPTSSAKLIGKYPGVPNNQYNHSNTVLGNQLQRAVVAITRAEDRGLRRARFQVVRNAAMPAALIECGFLSNPQEEQKLATPSYRETIALGIAQGILNYFALVNRAKVELGAPLTQAPVRKASVMPTVAPALIPAPARALGTATVSVLSGVAAPFTAPAAAPNPVPAPATVPVAPPVTAAPADAPPAAAPMSAAPVAAAAPPPAVKPVPAPPSRPAQAIAPPPLKLLNPNLANRAP